MTQRCFPETDMTRTAVGELEFCVIMPFFHKTNNYLPQPEKNRRGIFIQLFLSACLLTQRPQKFSIRQEMTYRPNIKRLRSVRHEQVAFVYERPTNGLQTVNGVLIEKYAKKLN